MEELRQARCLNHATREAAARCPECGHYFCRECITDHARRVICAKCLDQLMRRKGRNKRRWVGMGAVIQALAGLFLAWTLFYGIGRLLLLIPSDFHEGTVWTTGSDLWTDE